MNKVKLLLVLFISVSFPNAQQDSYGQFLVDGIGYTIKDRTNLLVLGSALLATTAAFQADYRVQEYAQKNGLMPEPLAYFGDGYGGAWAHWFLAAGMLSQHRKQGSTKAELWSKMQYAGTALAINGWLTIGLKRAVGRERPNQSNHHSFPSGHTSHSFTVAAISHELLGGQIGYTAYGLAVVVALSRIHDNKHYLSDVIAGGALGTVIGRGFGKAYRYGKGKQTVYLDGSGRLNWVWNF